MLAAVALYLAAPYLLEVEYTHTSYWRGGTIHETHRWWLRLHAIGKWEWASPWLWLWKRTILLHPDGSSAEYLGPLPIPSFLRRGHGPQRPTATPNCVTGALRPLGRERIDGIETIVLEALSRIARIWRAPSLHCIDLREEWWIRSPDGSTFLSSETRTTLSQPRPPVR